MIAVIIVGVIVYFVINKRQLKKQPTVNENEVGGGGVTAVGEAEKQALDGFNAEAVLEEEQDPNEPELAKDNKEGSEGAEVAEKKPKTIIRFKT